MNTNKTRDILVTNINVELLDDIKYIVMLNMDMDTLAGFCRNSKSIVCNNEQFWQAYVTGNNFYFAVPKDYKMLNQLTKNDSTWKEIFYNTYNLNTFIENNQQKNIKLFIDVLVKNGKIDTLKPYLIHNTFSTIVDDIIISGLKYNNYNIMDFMLAQNPNILDIFKIAQYANNKSYDYILSVNDDILPGNFVQQVITSNNVPLFKHIITKKEQITQQLMTIAITSGNIDMVQYLLSFKPNVNLSIGADIVYAKVSAELFSIGKDKEKIGNMAAYLVNNKIYGTKDSFIKYLIKTQNIKVLNDVNPPKEQKYITYAKNYLLSYEWFTN